MTPQESVALMIRIILDKRLALPGDQMRAQLIECEAGKVCVRFPEADVTFYKAADYDEWLENHPAIQQNWQN